MSDRDCKPDTDTTICPKCGFHREPGWLECAGCGLIFDRYRPGTRPGSPGDRHQAEKRPSLMRRAYRVLRWVAFAGTVVTLVLILRNSPPPVVETSPDAGLRAETKIVEFQATRDRGNSATLQLNEAELNAWVQSRLPATGHQAAPTATAGQPGPNEEMTVEQVRSNVRDIRLHLDGDNITAYVLFDLHGKEISLILEGKLEFDNGCLRMVPTAGRLGSLPLMETTLRGAASRLFDSPQNREKFCLPPGIRDVRIEGSNLILSSH
jgi:hypothetical protein